MQNFMKTILSAVQSWTKKEIKNSTADWNQNDSSKDSYIKNRTHWEEEDGTVHKLDSKYIDLPTNLATTDDVQGALNIADAAQNTANNAQNTANNAQRLAETNEVNLLTSIATSADMPKKSYSNCELIYGDGKILAITGRGFLCNSNGIDWTFASYNSTKSWSAGAYGDGKFVIIRDGQSGNINLNKFAYSTDGITWNATNVIPYIPGTTSTSLWSNIAYGAGKFVAISSGVGPHLAYSYDGITWTCDYNNATIYPLSYVKDLIYAGDKFVATGNNYIGYSLDGNTWKAVRTNSDFISITYGGGKFVVLGSRSKTNMAIYSADGVTWETAYLPIEADWHDVAYGNGKFVAVAQNDGIAAYSIDGIIWEKINVPNKQWRSVIYGNDRFIACSNTGEVMYSYDGIVWKTEYVKLYQNNEDVTDKIGETILDPKKLATEEYVSTKMNADNPVGTGSFSLNRKSGTTVGNYSHAEGLNATASGNHSHAEGYNTTASGNNQHVHGRYNIADLAEGDAKYVHIVGNGTSDTARSNAHTLDWNGVGWFQGGLQVGGNAQDDGAKNVLVEGDAIPVPSTAQVDQLLSVKAVDENGKPTEWEAVNAIKTVNNIEPDEDGNVELDAGFSPTATVEQTESGAVISITDKDGTTTATITNGQRGRSILHVTTEPSVWDNGEAPYRMPLKTIISQAGVNEVLVGDIVQRGYDQYKVFGMNEKVTFAYLDNPVSIKGADGTDGTDGKSAYEYAQEAGYTGTKTQFAKKLASDNGVSSWNALSDKPFYEIETSFNGDVTGKETFQLAEQVKFVKISDYVLSEEECINKYVGIKDRDTGIFEVLISSNGIIDATDTYGVSGFLVIPDGLLDIKLPVVVVVKESTEIENFSLSAGTYYATVDFGSSGAQFHTTYFSAFDDVDTVKKLDKKYLPDSAVQVEAVKKAVNPYFEGNIEGYTFLTFDGSNEEDGIGGLVKITDYILTEEECLGATVTASFEGVTFNDAITKKGDFTDTIGLPCDAYYADGSSTPYVVVIKSSGIGSGNIEDVEVSAGTYYIYMDTSGMDGGKTFITHFSALDNKEVVEEKINPKYLPSEVALKSDIPSIEGLASEEYVNDLINAALSAIPNAAEVAY